MYTWSAHNWPPGVDYGTHVSCDEERRTLVPCCGATVVSGDSSLVRRGVPVPRLRALRGRGTRVAVGADVGVD